MKQQIHMAVNKGPQIALNDQERFPLLENLGFLKQLKQDAHAPSYNFESGDRLNDSHLNQVNLYAQKIRERERHFWNENEIPEWINTYLAWCIKTVPFYKNRDLKFLNQTTIRRNDIHQAPWSFVSMDCNLDDLLVYQTSGTTGPAMDVIFDPVAQASWIPQMESILDDLNIKISRDPNRVAITMICDQKKTLTYASLSTYLEGAGVLKLNLHEGDWNQKEDRITYLEKYNPEVLTGDPFAFTSLYDLKPKIRPKVMISSAMKLSEQLKKQLEAYFQCPVIDVFSMTECRNIAFAEKDRYRAIRSDLYLEIFDPKSDQLLPEGEVGELVISGGNNPFLPLVRYRTGDFCSLKIENAIPYLYDFEAREPVLLYDSNGVFLNNINVSRAFAKFPLAGFSLHQSANYHLTVKAWSNDAIHKDLISQLHHLFGADISIDLDLLPVGNNDGVKPVNYSSDFEN